ncbi:MAG: hypothetical protein KF730_03850 [Sphingomonas sp.]|uniref:hypothetical protein n=1 Tax=Sphingomonas sp. TaxID=28214 RepID=UPI0025E33E0D|nr:hypothetical protein [Sphingomonas sp.]MBX3563692.1 hypothetical protein [Sphingomonas sp.]
MLIYALIAFGAGAIGGLVLASSVLRGRIARWRPSLLHAALGATGLGLLLAILSKGVRTRLSARAPPATRNAGAEYPGGAGRHRALRRRGLRAVDRTNRRRVVRRSAMSANTVWPQPRAWIS